MILTAAASLRGVPTITTETCGRSSLRRLTKYPTGHIFHASVEDDTVHGGKRFQRRDGFMAAIRCNDIHLRRFDYEFARGDTDGGGLHHNGCSERP